MPTQATAPLDPSIRSAHIADVYQSLQTQDNQNGDKDLTPGRIHVQSSVKDDGMLDGGPLHESKNEIKATFGGRSKALEMVQDTSFQVLDGRDPGSSTTDAIWAEQNICFLTGIELSRDGDTLSGFSLFIDRLHPENSKIEEYRPATAREI